MWLNILYFFFVVAISFGGNIHIGGTTPRQIAAILMFCITIGNIKLLRPYYSNFIKLYGLYLIIAAFSSFLDYNFDNFFRDLVSQHFVAMSCLGAFVVYYSKVGSFKSVIFAFVVCGLLNSAVCWLQYIGNPIGYVIGSLFISESDLQASRHMELLIEGNGSYLLGMRGDAVHNGYFMMIMPFLLTYLYKMENVSRWLFLKRILYIIILLQLFLVLFLIQERSCILFSGIVYILYLRNNFKYLNSSAKVSLLFFIPIIFVLIFVYLLPYIDTFLDNSRYVTGNDDLRLGIISNTFEFISNNFLLGGMSSFLRQYTIHPHCILLNAFVETGIFGFIITLMLYFEQIFCAYNLTKISGASLVIYAFIAYTLNSLLHNDSIITGDAIVWVLWGMVLCYKFRYTNSSVNHIAITQY